MKELEKICGYIQVLADLEVLIARHEFDDLLVPDGDIDRDIKKFERYITFTLDILRSPGPVQPDEKISLAKCLLEIAELTRSYCSKIAYFGRFQERQTKLNAARAAREAKSPLSGALGSKIAELANNEWSKPINKKARSNTIAKNIKGELNAWIRESREHDSAFKRASELGTDAIAKRIRSLKRRTDGQASDDFPDA
jgi:hypothetical protein